jgi:hypothetical protein
MSVKFHTGFPGVFPLFSLVLLLPSLAAVPARAASPNAPECGTGPTAEFLNARLAFWQQRLNLQDWKLSVESSHPADLKPETLGNIHWDPGKKTAVVRVLAVADYTMACPAALEDMELTVVHELVHLTLSPLRNSATNRSDEEHAVNQIADALLKLERQRRPREAAPVALIHR